MDKREEVLKDIKENPERHHHDFDGLNRCCFVDGAIDFSLMEAHSQYAPLGTNGGCPVRRTRRTLLLRGLALIGDHHEQEEA